MSRLSINKSFHRNGKNAQNAMNVSANNNTIYEGESPLQEKNRMNRTVCGAPIKSPASKFYRNNSNPLPGTVSCAPPVQETPKKIDESRQQKSFGKFLRYIRPSSKKKKIPTNDDSVCKQQEINLSLMSDELNITAPLHNVSNQIYEQSINKHGDVVEYAVPYSEQLITELQSPIKTINCEDRLCEDVVDENGVDKSTWNDQLNSLHALISPVKITDLDKSSDGSRSLNQSGKAISDSNNKELLTELDSLERWSENIQQRSLPPQEPPISKTFNVIECKPNEIKQRLSVLRNTIAIPLHFSSGYFRESHVALRKCCPRDPTSVGLVEEAIERDYDILNKVKHANIVLLMAVSFHRKSVDHMTLVLEPVDYTLNYFLHHMDTTLSMVESITVVQQIASAALYLQKCGYIHSNISSHNVLVRENPWCVKLSSFELTTEVDFADTRIEILIKYADRYKLQSLDSGSIDILKCTAIEDQNISKDQSKQMSKLLPVLKCSPKSQHKFLSMVSNHLVYDANYRQHLCVHNFQAPELLTTKRQFVFPTPKADVYSLCLLLWEMLNNCVPFVAYSKEDLVRMIASNKLNLPFYERERCQPFMDIFSVGLAVNPQNRAIDVKQLVTMLDDVKFQIRSGITDQNKEHNVQPSDTVAVPVNVYVNTTPQAKQRIECITAGSTFSPSSSDFNHCLHENELTSTKKKRKKSPQKFIKKNTFRQLFKHSMEADNEIQFTHAQLNENLDAIASEIRREQSLDEIEEESESIYDSIVGPALANEHELPSTNLTEKQDTENISSEHTEWRKTSPEIVDFKVSAENQSVNSKSCSNLFDASTSESRRKTFHSNILSPPSTGFTIGEFSLPDTPIARKNKIRRNAWLSNKSLNLSTKDINEMENQDQPPRLDDSNQQNVSIRIVHNKVTPKKVDGGHSLVTSRIKFFDSTTETSNMDVPASNSKISNNDRLEDIDTNYSANYPVKNSSSKEIVELATAVRNGPSSSHRYTERTLSNCSTLPMSHKNSADSRSNRSLGSSDTDEESNVITPKWRSVRDKILKFEKRGQLVKRPSTSLTTSTELVRNLSRSVTATQSNSIKFNEVPTLIKRTIYRESIVSGVDLSSLDNQMPSFDQFNLPGQKLTTQVTLNMRQIRRRSSDLDETDRRKMEGITGMRNTICGSQKALLSFSKVGSSCGKTKYICSECASKMSQDELKALNCESVAESPFNATNVTDHSLPSPIQDCQRTPQRRCQVRVKAQNTRSIEDLYIDDDFDQGLGLGANIELQSDCSDFLNFDIIADVFNKSDADA